MLYWRIEEVGEYQALHDHGIETDGVTRKRAPRNADAAEGVTVPTGYNRILGLVQIAFAHEIGPI